MNFTPFITERILLPELWRINRRPATPGEEEQVRNILKRKSSSTKETFLAAVIDIETALTK